jgi:glutamate-ammonia-ligase adenylyltransferase
VYGDGIDLPEVSVSQREFFVRLAQKTIEILSRITSQGPVFRIDLRLRPQGNEGELAVSLGHALRYYAEGAADWELQALIKVRHSGGDTALAREFIRAVRPFVYTEGLNFAAIKTALTARERIQKSRKLKVPLSGSQDFSGIDVKLDAGGIRDIEFLAQCLQRVYGGGEPWVRSGGTLFSLQKLHDNGHISGKDFHELSSTYEYLRHVEHRLQLRQGQQTHRLPSDRIELQILQRAMSGYVSASQDAVSLIDTVRRRMLATAEIYQRVIHHQERQGAEQLPSAFHLRSGLESIGDASTGQILQRLASDSPALYQKVIQSELSNTARTNFFRFLSAAFTSSERYSALLENAVAVDRALHVFESSDYLSHILIRHPEEITTLAELDDIPARAGSGYLFESSLGHVYAADPVFEFLGSGRASFAESQSLLRRQFRHRVLVAGAKDVLFRRPVAESLAETTAAAEDAIRAALGIVGAPENLAILALGRLGAGEFDVLSDADLLFLCDHDSADAQKTVERIVHLLNAYTQDGVVFSVDSRLRPHGRAGELLITPARLQVYFQEQARAWEVLSFTKARFIAGSRALADQSTSIVQSLFDRFAGREDFRNEVLKMRSRLETANRSWKTSAGGLYDIDFLCAYLLVQSPVPEKGGTLRDRLWRCANADLLGKASAAKLDHAAELLLSVDHATRLLLGREQTWLPAGGRTREATEKLAANMLGATFKHGLEQELTETMHTVRGIYDRGLGAPA